MKIQNCCDREPEMFETPQGVFIRCLTCSREEFANYSYGMEDRIVVNKWNNSDKPEISQALFTTGKRKSIMRTRRRR